MKALFLDNYIPNVTQVVGATNQYIPMHHMIGTHSQRLAFDVLETQAIGLFIWHCKTYQHEDMPLTPSVFLQKICHGMKLKTRPYIVILYEGTPMPRSFRATCHEHGADEVCPSPIQLDYLVRVFERAAMRDLVVEPFPLGPIQVCTTHNS